MNAPGNTSSLPAMYKPLLLVTSLVSLGACSTDGEERCEDPKYGNGTCDVQTSCAEPDIDCFTTFETQEEAQAWYAGTSLAAERPPIPATDARFARMQELITKGWEAYQAVNPVGELAKEKAHLVLVDDTQPNAFAMSSNGSIGLVVMVTPKLIDLGAPDEQLMGVVMHELEHAIGLHVLPQVNATFNKYYLAPAGSEPLGFQQADNPVVRALVEEWVDQAETVGYLDDVELRGLPITGQLTAVFDRRLAMQPNTAACATAKNNLASLRNTIVASANLLDDSITLNANAPAAVLNAMNAIQAQCFAGFTQDAIDVAAAHFKVTRAVMLAEVPIDLRPSIEGQTYIQGMYNWHGGLRTKMREIEARFQQMTGQPWSRARYYSTEEAADDSTVPVLRAMGLAADGAGLFLPKLVANLEPICRPLVDGNQPIPYGERLDDTHHGFCWRAGHIKAIAALGPQLLAAPAAPLRAGPRLERRRSIFAPPPKTYSH